MAVVSQLMHTSTIRIIFITYLGKTVIIYSQMYTVVIHKH